MSSPRFMSGMQASERMARPCMERPRGDASTAASASVTGLPVRSTVFRTDAGISSSGFAWG